MAGALNLSRIHTPENFKSFVSNRQRMEQVVSRRSSYEKRGGRVVGKARFANECAWPPTPRADNLRCDDNFAHSYTVMLCAHLVLASLQKRPWSWCWNRRKCAREENCRCNRWWKLNEAIVFVSIIILLNYMILALVWCFNAPSLNMFVYKSIFFSKFNILKMKPLRFSDTLRPFFRSSRCYWFVRIF